MSLPACCWLTLWRHRVCQAQEGEELLTVYVRSLNDQLSSSSSLGGGAGAQVMHRCELGPVSRWARTRTTRTAEGQQQEQKQGWVTMVGQQQGAGGWEGDLAGLSHR